MGSAQHYARSSDELDEAVRFYDDAGWLDDPVGRHPAPTQPPDAEIAPARGSPSRPRAAALRQRVGAGRTASPAASAGAPSVPTPRSPCGSCATRGRPRPWLVAVHGQGMGRPSDDRMLRVLRLHEELGINLALPVLPLHGPRAAGFAPDQQFVSNVHPVNNVLGLTQSVWDLRRLLLWLRGRPGGDRRRGPRALAGVLRVQPPVDRRGRPRLRRRGRAHERPGRLAPVVDPGVPVQAPAAPRAARRTVDARPPCRLAGGAAVPGRPTIGASSSPARPIGSPLPPVPRSCGGTGTSRRSSGARGATSPRLGPPSTTTTSPPSSPRVGLHAPR